MRLPAFVRAVAAVLAGFIGIRGRKHAERDAQHIRPLHIIAAGIVSIAAFITILLTVVKSVLS